MFELGSKSPSDQVSATPSARVVINKKWEDCFELLTRPLSEFPFRGPREYEQSAIKLMNSIFVQDKARRGDGVVESDAPAQSSVVGIGWLMTKIVEWDVISNPRSRLWLLEDMGYLTRQNGGLTIYGLGSKGSVQPSDRRGRILSESEEDSKSVASGGSSVERVHTGQSRDVNLQSSQCLSELVKKLELLKSFVRYDLFSRLDEIRKYFGENEFVLTLQLLTLLLNGSSVKSEDRRLRNFVLDEIAKMLTLSETNLKSIKDNLESISNQKSRNESIDRYLCQQLHRGITSPGTWLHQWVHQHIQDPLRVLNGYALRRRALNEIFEKFELRRIAWNEPSARPVLLSTTPVALTASTVALTASTRMAWRSISGSISSEDSKSEGESVTSPETATAALEALNRARESHGSAALKSRTRSGWSF